MLSATGNLACLLGILIAFALGSFLHWRTIALISCGFHLTSFIALFFIPESPHWLLSKNRTFEAQKSLAYLRGWTTVESIQDDYKEIYMDVNKSTSKSNSILGQIQSLGRKEFLWPFVVVSFCFVLAHCTGMQNLQIYAIPIFNSFKIEMNPYFATVILGAVQLVASMLCVSIINYTGKRMMNFVCLILVGVCNVVIGVYAQVNHLDSLILIEGEGNQTSTLPSGNISVDGHSWIPLTFLIILAFITNAGIRVLPWVLTGELFPHNIRALAAGLSAAISYIIMFIASKTFFNSIELLTLGGTFYTYAALSFLGTVILYFILPETEGKSLTEICDHYAGGKKLSNKVLRSTQKQTINEQEGKVNISYIQDDVYTKC